MVGAPVASEHHSVDACEAALAMQRAVADYAAEVDSRYGSRLVIRVSLHSGEVVVLTVGDGTKVEYDTLSPCVRESCPAFDRRLSLRFRTRTPWTKYRNRINRPEVRTEVPRR